MADYDFRPGGSLKLKGGEPITKKKKKSKTKESIKDSVLNSKSKGKERELSRLSEDPLSSGVDDTDVGPPEEGGKKRERDEKKTEAERRFEERQRKILERKIQQMAKKTHKDRVHEFNAKLESLSEHHDIPKVGPG